MRVANAIAEKYDNNEFMNNSFMNKKYFKKW